MPELSIFTLGPLTISLGGQPLRDLTSVKAQALLVYLAIAQRPQSRQALAGLLWPDVSEDSARGSLRTTLGRLRQAVGDFVVADRQSISIEQGGSLWVDAHAFEDACRQFQSGRADAAGMGHDRGAAVREAIHLYRDEFLADFYAPDAALFEEWLRQQREYYRRLALDGLQVLAQTALDSGRSTLGIEDAHRLLELDPAREESYRLLMKLYVQSGQPDLALRQYQACVQALAAELDVPPSAETEALHDAIREGRFSPPPTAIEVQRFVPASSAESLADIVSEPADVVRTNLPQPTTSFVGRERELVQLHDRLADPQVRLLTIVGLGGVGKTRLAVEAARREAAGFADGVYFVSLETLHRADQIGAAIASSLGLSVESADPYQLALHFLARKQLLLVLDNFEHLLDGAGLVSDILAQCPGVKALVTSRETLNLQEEWFYPVGGLDLPDLLEGSAEQVRRSAAVQFFLQNAQRALANRDFTAELPCIVRVCRIVEGAPLALELAAHWLRTLSCGQIVEQLQQNLDLLATPVRNVPERHRSMRAVFDYSWQLAGPRERAILCQLSVFAGGFDWEAFQAVARGTLVELSLLVESSWVQRSQSERYTLHPLVRSYLAEKLAQAYSALGDEGVDAVRDRHSLHYAQVVKGSVTTVLQREIDNVVAGWRHAVERLEPDILYRYASHTALYLRSWPLPLREFEALWEEATNRVRRPRGTRPNPSDDDAVLEVMLLHVRGVFLRRSGRTQEAEALFAEALSVLEDVGERADAGPLRAITLLDQGLNRITQGRYAEAETVVDMAQELGGKLMVEPWFYLCWGAYDKGHRADEMGDYDAASAFLHASLGYIPAGHRTYRPLTFWAPHARLSGIAIKQGKREDARRHFAAVMEVLGNIGHFQQLEFAVRPAEYELLVGNASAALAACQTLLSEVQAYGYDILEAQTLTVLGKANLALGQLAEAESAYQNARQVAEGRFFQLSVAALAGQGAVAVRQGQYRLAEERFRQVLDEAWPAGLLPEVLEAVIGLAEVRAHEGDTVTARRWLEVAMAHPATVYLVRVHAQDMLVGLGVNPSPDEMPDPQTALAEIVTQLVANNGEGSTAGTS